MLLVFLFFFACIHVFAEDSFVHIESEKKYIHPYSDENRCDGEYFFRNHEGYIVTICIDDLQRECLLQQKELSIDSCNITKDNLYSDFLSLQNKKKSDEVLWSLIKKGKFSVSKNGTVIRRVFFAEFYWYGHYCEGVLSDDGHVLYHRILETGWWH